MSGVLQPVVVLGSETDRTGGGDEVGRLVVALCHSANASDSAVKRGVQALTPILESFGHAHGAAGACNAARFARRVTLTFAADGLRQIRVQTCLLERSRVTRLANKCGADERNFHAFYQLLSAPAKLAKGRPKELVASDSSRIALRYAANSRAVHDADDVARHATVVGALKALIDESEAAAGAGSGVHTDKLLRRRVWPLLGGLLLLGEVEFVGDGEASQVAEEAACAAAAAALGVDAKTIGNALCHRVVQLRGETLRVPLGQEAAATARDALAKEVYSRLFTWLVSRVNQHGTHHEPLGSVRSCTIDVIHSVAFERQAEAHSTDAGEAALEALRRNFTADVLRATFAAEAGGEQRRVADDAPRAADDAARARADTDVLTLQRCLALVPTLNDLAPRVHGSSLDSEEDDREFARVMRSHQQRDAPAAEGATCFGVCHVGGHEARYDVAGCFSAHRAALPSDLVDLCANARNALLRVLFAPDNAPPGPEPLEDFLAAGCEPARRQTEAGPQRLPTCFVSWSSLRETHDGGVHALRGAATPLQHSDFIIRYGPCAHGRGAGALDGGVATLAADLLPPVESGTPLFCVGEKFIWLEPEAVDSLEDCRRSRAERTVRLAVFNWFKFHRTPQKSAARKKGRKELTSAPKPTATPKKGQSRNMSARSYIEQFKAILEGGVPVLKLIGDTTAGSEEARAKLKKRPRVLYLVKSGAGRALQLSRPRSLREHAMFANWHGSAWWEKLAARGARGHGASAAASYAARRIIAGRSALKRGSRKMLKSFSDHGRRLITNGASRSSSTTKATISGGDSSNPDKQQPSTLSSSWCLTLAELKEVVEETPNHRLTIVPTDETRSTLTLEMLSSHVHSYCFAGLTLIILESQKTSPKAGSWTVPDVPPELLSDSFNVNSAKSSIMPLEGSDLDHFTRLLAAGLRLRKHPRRYANLVSPPRRRVFFLRQRRCLPRMAARRWSRRPPQAAPVRLPAERRGTWGVVGAPGVVHSLVYRHRAALPRSEFAARRTILRGRLPRALSKMVTTPRRGAPLGGSPQGPP